MAQDPGRFLRLPYIYSATIRVVQLCEMLQFDSLNYCNCNNSCRSVVKLRRSATKMLQQGRFSLAREREGKRREYKISYYSFARVIAHEKTTKNLLFLIFGPACAGVWRGPSETRPAAGADPTPYPLPGEGNKRVRIIPRKCKKRLEKIPVRTPFPSGARTPAPGACRYSRCGTGRRRGRAPRPG